MMDLAECLRHLPQHHVLRIARDFGFDGRSLPSDLVGTLSDRIKDVSYLSRVASSLSEEELTALKMVALCGGGKGIVVEKCHQKLNELTRKWRRNGAKVLDVLIRAGLVYTGRENYRQIYFIPNDLRGPVVRVLMPSILDRISTRDCVARATDPEPMMPTRHIHLFLSYLKKNQVRIAQSGTVYRRSQRDIISSLGLPDDLPDESESFQAVHPLHLAFIVNYCKKRGLTTETEQREILISDKVEDWIVSPAPAKAMDVFASVFEEWVCPDPDVQTMLAIMDCVPEGQWVSFTSLLDEMEYLSLEHSWHGLETRLGKAVRMLSYAGVLTGADSEKGALVRLTGPGRVLTSLVTGRPVSSPDEVFDGVPLEDSFFLQGTFEMLVPANIEPSILWRIEHIADLVKPDQMLIYRITRQSIYRALSTGMSSQSILGFLGRHSKNDIPQNVSYSIEEWSKGYGRVEFVDALVLQCDTEDLANEIRASKRMQPFVIGQISPRHLIIDRTKHVEALEALQGDGYMPKPGVRHEVTG